MPANDRQKINYSSALFLLTKVPKGNIVILFSCGKEKAMTMAKTENKRRPGRPGHLGDAARALRVNHSHLWRVVHGHRVAPPTLRAYQAWRKTHVGA
jgi:hypothetical protein